MPADNEFDKLLYAEMARLVENGPYSRNRLPA